MIRSIIVAASLCFGGGTLVQAQSANLNFGGLSVDPSAAVEISADTLNVDQATGQAVFSGAVKIGQGGLKLSADRVEIVYANSGDIDRMTASGNVLFVTATEEAEAQSAVYSLSEQTLVLQGDVLLSQGQSALLADSMRINLASGNAVMNGRVRTVLQPSSN
ncbi:MAG: lipopolysaccharide transport periplasmic protein LptA [Planktomarina sp.]